jgi:ABC transporter substrate binding protein (PQQ-dependent alcohol dehydrogenase system)
MAQETARIVYLGLEDDVFYEPRPGYTGLSLRDRQRPLSGAKVAMRGARVLGRALGIEFELEEVLVRDVEAAVDATRKARETGALAVILDIPAEVMSRVATAEGSSGGLLFNIRHRGGRWRSADCAPDLLHTIPSGRMLSDALAQHLRFRGWDEILLLSGSSVEDIRQAESARQSLAKFGLDIVDEKTFELSNDPRHRTTNNIALITGGVDYDAIWLIDNEGEFGRYVPFATNLPRPVIGSEGLVAGAWHWTYERYGAPQLNQRFRRDSGREMTSEDWSAWVAVRTVLESVSRVGSADANEVAAFAKSERLSLDLYKGVPGSYRSWDRQLRQPVLLGTHNAVISRAPLDGFEHRSDTLDTLGIDHQESGCDL